MTTRIAFGIATSLLALAAAAHLGAQTRSTGAQTSRGAAWPERTPWGDPDLLDPAPQRDAPLSEAIRMYMGDARGRWDGPTLVVESSHFKANARGSTPGLRLIERFTRTGQDAIQYEVTFVDPATWTAPWTAAVDLKARPADAGVFEYACHEGNYGMANMLSASRSLERTASEGRR